MTPFGEDNDPKWIFAVAQAGAQSLADTLEEVSIAISKTRITLSGFSDLIKTYEELTQAEYRAAPWYKKLWIAHREAVRDHELNGTWYVTPEWVKA